MNASTMMCARLGVSRFPVSEALGRLAAEGLVEVLPQRGTRVARIDLADCRQAMFIRRALEIAAVRNVAPRADAGLLAALDRNLRDHLGRSPQELAVMRGYVDIAAEFDSARISATPLGRFLRDS